MNTASNTAEIYDSNTTSEESFPDYLTLCDLIDLVSESTKNDRLTAKVVARLLNSGKVKLIGSFKGRKIVFI